MAKELGVAPPGDVGTEMAGGRGESPGLGSATSWVRRAGGSGTSRVPGFTAALPGDSLIGGLRLRPAPARDPKRNQLLLPCPTHGVWGR